jgi:hypothetical protein
MSYQPAEYRWSERKRGTKIPYGKPKPRNLTKEQVYELVREYVLGIRERGSVFGGDTLTAESLAREFNVGLDRVQWALHKANLSGLVTQKFHRPPHDSPRARPWMGQGSDSAWCASIYYVRFPITPMTVFPPYKPADSKPIRVPEGTIGVWDEKPREKKPRYSKKLRRRIA